MTISDFKPSREQHEAIDKIHEWWNCGRRRKQVFRLFGFAGVGKSTVLRYALSDLGIDDHSPEHPGVVTATFTGKAALVLQLMGIPARTIHSLIYRYIDPTVEEITKIEDQIREATASAAKMDGEERVSAEASIAAMRGVLDGLLEPQFILDHLGSDAADCRLIVLDEVSMVDGRMASDLLSFGKPILVLGDPGQLSPINDNEGYFTRREPDAMLTEIHRQAADSPIIRLATMARKGEPIPFGKHGPGVAKISKSKAPPDALLRATQVLCARNATRRWLNNRMREASGIREAVLPKSGERLICLRNDMQRGLINGMFLKMEGIREETPVSFSAKVYDENGVPIGHPTKTGRAIRQQIYRGPFDDHVRHVPDRAKRDWHFKRGLVEADHGRAITVHKAQGSEFDRVVVWDERLPGSELDYRRLLYTAITRASEGLCIVSDG